MAHLKILGKVGQSKTSHTQLQLGQVEPTTGSLKLEKPWKPPVRARRRSRGAPGGSAEMGRARKKPRFRSGWRSFTKRKRRLDTNWKTPVWCCRTSARHGAFAMEPNSHWEYSQNSGHAISFCPSPCFAIGVYLKFTRVEVSDWEWSNLKDCCPPSVHGSVSWISIDFTGEAEQNCLDVSTKVRMWLFDERLTTDLMDSHGIIVVNQDAWANHVSLWYLSDLWSTVNNSFAWPIWFYSNWFSVRFRYRKARAVGEQSKKGKYRPGC